MAEKDSKSSYILIFVFTSLLNLFTTSQCSAVAYPTCELDTIATTSVIIPDHREEFRLGIKIGISGSTVKTANNIGYDPLPSLGVVSGVSLSIPLNKYFGIQPELIFAQRGFKLNSTASSSFGSFTRRSSFLDIPLYAVYKPLRFVQILIGPQYSYLIDQQDSNVISFFSENGVITNEVIKKNQHRMGISGGVDFQIQNLVIGLRAGSDLFRETSQDMISWQEYKNVWTQLTVCYSFPL